VRTPQKLDRLLHCTGITPNMREQDQRVDSGRIDCEGDFEAIGCILSSFKRQVSTRLPKMPGGAFITLIDHPRKCRQRCLVLAPVKQRFGFSKQLANVSSRIPRRFRQVRRRCCADIAPRLG
jgi:hypothetical protein